MKSIKSQESSEQSPLETIIIVIASILGFVVGVLFAVVLAFCAVSNKSGGQS